ncbi:MAG TPA: hypothetical protein VHU42_08200, partial [Rhodopila sp.]|nr:hypothetical protein [Rhodopila sp.]
MILDQPTRTLEIILGEAMATSNCDIVACYATSALASGTSGGTFTTAVAQAASNGTTAVTVVPAPAGGAQTQVNEVRVHNNDTISHRIMLRLNDGGTVRIVLAKTVSAGSDFLYSPTTQSDAGGGIQADGTTITNTAGVISVTYGTTANTAAEGNDARITGALSASGAATTYAPLVSPLLSATTQTAPAVVNANVTAPAAATSTAVVQVIGKDATGVKVEVDGYGGTPGFAGRRADGTQAAPTAVAANDTLMQMSAFGYGATGFSAAFRASYNIYSAEGWTDTAQGTFHSFFTTAKGTTTTSEKARLSDAGHLLIGTTTDDGTNLLQVAGG